MAGFEGLRSTSRTDRAAPGGRDRVEGGARGASPRTRISGLLRPLAQHRCEKYRPCDPGAARVREFGQPNVLIPPAPRLRSQLRKGGAAGEAVTLTLERAAVPVKASASSGGERTRLLPRTGLRRSAISVARTQCPLAPPGPQALRTARPADCSPASADPSRRPRSGWASPACARAASGL